MRTSIGAWVAVLISMMIVGQASAQKGPNTGPPVPAATDVTKLMSDREFHAAGLAKLTPDEIAALNQWLSSILLKLLSTNEAASSPCRDAIEANISGEFKGWAGESIYKLSNGQIWQQAVYTYTYTYKYGPSVLIYSGRGGCMMKVEDAESVAVKRLK